MTQFINLSNHPSAKWSDAQREAAQQIGTIIDMPFPAISPNATHQEVQNLVEEYVERVEAFAQKASVVVHVMGELTFNFAFVSRMKALSIKCVASTTQRIVNEIGDSKKEVEFHFVAFREY